MSLRSQTLKLYSLVVRCNVCFFSDCLVRSRCRIGDDVNWFKWKLLVSVSVANIVRVGSDERHCFLLQRMEKNAEAFQVFIHDFAVGSGREYMARSSKSCSRSNWLK